VSSERVRPVPRSRVAAATGVFLLLLGGTILLAETLRHPHPGLGPVVPELGGDPRDPIECPDPIPREGQPRFPAPAGQDPVAVTSNELYDCPDVYDAAEVRYRGEVVGGVLHRDDGAWVQLNDDIYGDPGGPLPTHRDYRGGNAGVGVFLPAGAATKITWVGGPATRGDVLEVVGRFQRVDPVSREVAVIRAEQVTVAVEGGIVDHPVLRDRQVAALILAIMAAAVVVAERFRAARR
jgi:hypothetical protein